MFSYNGFFKSIPIEWSEEHGGATIHHKMTEYWRFLPNGLYIFCSRYDESLDYWNFSELLVNAIPQNIDNDIGNQPLTDAGEELFLCGTYSIADNTLTAKLVRSFNALSLANAEYIYSWKILQNQLLPINEDSNSLTFNENKKS